MAKYFGRDGRPCQRSEWSRLRDDREYRIIREYDNGQVYVRLEWLGEVADPSTFRDCWKMFALCVGNYNANGDIKEDPVENGKTFAYEKDGIAAYEAFLERWTASHRNADGEFEEEDAFEFEEYAFEDYAFEDYAFEEEYAFEQEDAFEEADAFEEEGCICRVGGGRRPGQRRWRFGKR